MIPCEVFRRHLDAVVDGEVDPDTHLEVELHLAECGPCRVQLAFARSFKRQVRSALIEGTPVAPEGLAERVRRALDAESSRHAELAPQASPRAEAEARDGFGIRFLRPQARYAVPAAAAALALAVWAAREGGNPDTGRFGPEAGFAGAGSTGAGPIVASSASYLDDVVERHWRDHPVEVSGPPTQVASWFRGKLHFPVVPIEFADTHARLVGARISSVRDREAAAFFYDVEGHRVTVLVFEPPTPMRQVVQQAHVRGRGVYYGRARGHTVPLVEHGGLTYAFAGDLDSRALLQLAASARMQAR